jgi:hypothetical protein
MFLRPLFENAQKSPHFQVLTCAQWWPPGVTSPKKTGAFCAATSAEPSSWWPRLRGETRRNSWISMDLW